jgi:secreted Zn-dependent insulinase-like peptidase
LQPSEHPGVAHLLEHMVFQGTEKYPDSSEYSAYLEKYGGGSNASTSLSRTNYYFFIGNEGFPEALDRLA